MICQYIRSGHSPTVISATRLSNFLCKRASQATLSHTHRASSVFTLTLHEPQPSPLAEQLYILSSLWHLGCCFLQVTLCSSEQIGCLGSPLPPHVCTPPLKVIIQDACPPWSSTEQAVLFFFPSRLFYFLQFFFFQEEAIYPELKHLVIVLPG